MGDVGSVAAARPETQKQSCSRRGLILTLIRCLLWTGVLLFGVVIAAAAEINSSPIPCTAGTNLAGVDVVAHLMSRNAGRAREVRDFTSTRQYRLHYTGFPSPLAAEMQVKVSYSAAGTKEFAIESESGSKLVLNRVLHRLLESEKQSSSDDANRAAVALTTDNYNFSLLGCSAVDGRPQYVMQVAPLRDDKFLYRGTIWIDATDFAVTHIEAEPARNPSFWTKRTVIHHDYQNIGGLYVPVLNQTVTDVRMGGKAVLTIRYLDYRMTAASSQ